MAKKINIRPTSGVYATYKNIKYDPWTAIAEFVDNSTQSFYDYETQLEKTKYWDGLNVEIIYERNGEDGDKLIIRDNAYGMDFRDFQRAIVLDSPPKKKTRSEFGMGLKTAACWLGVRWSVESTELNSAVKYKASIDVDALHKYKDEEIVVDEIPCNPKEHGTTITIWNLNRTMSGRQISKTKDQLRGMYRSDLRTGKIHIYYNGESLTYETPKVLVEELPDGNQKIWRKDINFSVLCSGQEYNVKGFIGLLDEGSTSGAGFTLIRHGRVIIGGYENGYRPEEIFEKANSFVYQRLFGELNMDNWPVTQTKDAFDWYSGLEDLLIEKLLEECEEYRKKAKEYRKWKKVIIDTSVNKLVNNFSSAGIIEDVEVEPLCDDIIEKKVETSRGGLINDVKKSNIEPNIEIVGNQGTKLIFNCGSESYIFNFILKFNDPEARWLNITHKDDEYIVEWNIRHPFFKPYIDEPEFLEIMKQFTFALALSEIEARRTGIEGKIEPGAIRMKMNETLKAVIKENKG